MPRTLLIVDEFQELFAEDDRIAQTAAALLDRLVRQGRAFGVHAILGSQTLGGATGLARSTMGQMAVRIALQCSEGDSQMILSDENTAARLLSRPGEALYNDAGGAVEANSPFQVAWLADAERQRRLEAVAELAQDRHAAREPALVFEGNAPAELPRNSELARLLAADDWPAASGHPVAWLGDPITIKSATGVTLRRQGGSNVMLVGQRDEAALAVTSAAVLSLAAQQAPDQARFYLFDGSPADSPLAGRLQRLGEALPHDVRGVPWRGVEDALSELSEEVERRKEADAADAGAVYAVVFGLQRYRMLRRQEDAFSFSLDEENAGGAKPDRQFAELLRDGPGVGVHTLCWCDTAGTLDRTLERTSLREFDHRVLFQMSAADSSNLIDSPEANHLGLYRALYYSEEQGRVEKFRPYAPAPAEWLTEVAGRLRRRR